MKEFNEKWNINLPIMIPSLRREMGNGRLQLDFCLEDFFRFHDSDNVHVLAQEYSKEEQEKFEEKFPNVEFDWRPKRMGIINTFNELKDWGCSLGKFYVHKDDDVKTMQQFIDNSTLLAMENLMKIAPDRIGIVTTPSISVHHFSKVNSDFIKLYCNPAQYSLINSDAAKNCKYDSNFENFRSDTDFTMQIAKNNYVPLIISKFFSFMHMVPMSKIQIDENGKRMFSTLDNVKETKGSVGGDRRHEKRIEEYNKFQEKWPKVITFKNYKQQIFKKSIIHLTGITDDELQTYNEKFDYSIVKNLYPEYYGEEIISPFRNRVK